MNKLEVLAQIEKAVHNCKKCRLYKGATHGVPGEGNPNAKIAFIGEAPGFNEDKLGRPFVGRAGKMLEDMLHGMGLKREDVWIGNVIKHRPPDNRNPMVDEVRACALYLEAQLKAINPKIIVTLGKFALEYFDKDGKISRDHGVPKKIGNKIVFPLYHPAAALRNPAVEKVLRSEFKKIKELTLKDLKDFEEKDFKKKDDKQTALF
ncbi:uracil-DNA glycosylase [candidate division WWE3 bacterium]|nr:uracil-DNA glycosylase [candidate division WWE3 bacterium]